jgi:signal peptide peptidase SppA
MRFTHLAEQIYHRPWFITAEAHAAIRTVFERALSSGLFKSPGFRSMGFSSGPLITDVVAEEINLLDLFPKRRPLAIDKETGIASIHIMGPIGKNLSKVEQSCGATGFEQIRADYAKALEKGARGILLDFDSPGGTITGTPELANLIASKPLPTVAYTEDMMASAAYYLAAGADAIFASPSASVGSIGVYVPWVDTSAAYERAGYKPDPIVNTGGDLKAAGFGGKLTAEQRAHLQEEVDEDFDNFKAHIANYRAVPDSAMRGQVMSGRKALEANLVDRIGERDQAYGALARTISAGTQKLAA